MTDDEFEFAVMTEEERDQRELARFRARSWEDRAWDGVFDGVGWVAETAAVGCVVWVVASYLSRIGVF